MRQNEIEETSRWAHMSGQPQSRSESTISGGGTMGQDRSEE